MYLQVGYTFGYMSWVYGTSVFEWHVACSPVDVSTSNFGQRKSDPKKSTVQEDPRMVY